MFCDYHVHSEFSDDSTYLVENIIQDAIKMDMDEICITDHVDYGIKPDYNEVSKEESVIMPLNVNYPVYFTKLDNLKEKYKSKIMIKQGLEFGVQTHTIQKYEELYQKYKENLDFVILSIHQVNNREFWNYDFQNGKTEHQHYQSYYKEMYQCVQNFHHYSVLGHMDMLKRYDDQENYDAFKENIDIIIKILKYIIADGKGIELNTSSVKYGLNDTMPAQSILKLYYDLGGRIITIGSDSHKKGELGASIERMKKVLINIGFKEFCTFENMQPIFHEL